ncbi:hypothetical protein DVK85_01600 [Flavobacterium arcticum]|uniref:Uncharacterized protein n=1 Tax=Flavobacterium arcticum TaxID=1784713 RepID=A0A345H8T7_9FLAO|nr:hypothetical protein [Flavobacterium arcticum]AXG72997.1 hypothetical protein DVK85_01600 [Flavobacterium arcticum]KAF2510339.1 hypothetical protein E0W72_07605 [Flavobacterium arcticum]
MKACRTAKIEEVVNDASAAIEQVKKLENQIKSEENIRKQEFLKRIDEYLSLAGVNDERFIQENTYIKVEYASEFSLDKIVEVVKGALQAAADSAVATNPTALLSSDAADSYSEVVVSIGEAAKSSSSTAAIGSFSATRLAPGIIAFVYTTSVTIEEIQTFGTEAITATALHYALIESNQDFAQTKHIETIQCTIKAALKAYKDFITLQALLVDRLTKGELTLEEYIELDSKYAETAKKLRERVQAAIDDVEKPEITKNSYNLDWLNNDLNKSILNERSLTNRMLVESSLNLLTSYGKKYQPVIDLNTERLKTNFY